MDWSLLNSLVFSRKGQETICDPSSLSSAHSIWKQSWCLPAVYLTLQVPSKSVVQLPPDLPEGYKLQRRGSSYRFHENWLDWWEMSELAQKSRLGRDKCCLGAISHPTSRVMLPCWSAYTELQIDHTPNSNQRWSCIGWQRNGVGDADNQKIRFH